MQRGEQAIGRINKPPRGAGLGKDWGRLARSQHPLADPLRRLGDQQRPLPKLGGVATVGWRWWLVHALWDVSNILDLDPLHANSAPGVVTTTNASGRRWGTSSAQPRAPGLTTCPRQQVSSASQPKGYVANSLGGPLSSGGSPRGWGRSRRTQGQRGLGETVDQACSGPRMAFICHLG